MWDPEQVTCSLCPIFLIYKMGRIKSIYIIGLRRSRKDGTEHRGCEVSLPVSPNIPSLLKCLADRRPLQLLSLLLYSPLSYLCCTLFPHWSLKRPFLHVLLSDMVHTHSCFLSLVLGRTFSAFYSIPLQGRRFHSPFTAYHGN